jgi:radical SAM superfamily enzyme YgiQ (UPF0313 family)
MFDNTKPNVILLTDMTHVLSLSKSLGPYKVAHELRLTGFEVAVINHLHIFSYEELLNILQQLISDQTLFIGVSPFFYENIDNPIVRDDGGIEFRPKELGAFLPHGMYKNTDFKKFVQSCNPKCKLVLGGPDAQDYEYAKLYDYVIKGYGDVSIVNLAKHLLDSTIKLEKSHKSIYGPIIINDSKAETFDFVASTMQYADHDGILPGETLVIEISRGCIFDCSFCSYPLNGKKKLDYIKHEENLYCEFLDNYQKFGVSRYIFSDDTFNDSREKIEMLHRISKKLPFQLEYWCYLRLDLLAVHPDTFDLMVESGLRSCYFGIETLDEEAGKHIGKGGQRHKQVDMLKHIKEKYKNHVSITGSFIIGVPGESLESCQATIDWVFSNECPLDTAAVRAMTMHLLNNDSIFASKIEQYPEKYGYSFPKEKDHTISSELTSMGRNWTNEHMDFATAVELESKFYKRRFSEKFKLPGNSAFDFAGLGIELDIFFTTPMKDLPWHKISLLKQQRSQEYKNTLYKKLKIHNTTT